METLAVAIIAAGAAIASAIISAVLSSRKIDKQLALHEKDSQSRKSSLSHEHSDLSGEHADLLKEHKRLVDSICDVDSVVGFLKDEKLKELGRVEQLNDAQRCLVESAKNISSFADEFAKLAVQNLALIKENARLKESLQKARGSKSHESDFEHEP